MRNRLERVDEQKTTYEQVFMQLLQESRTADIIEDYKLVSRVTARDLKYRRQATQEEHRHLDKMVYVFFLKDERSICCFK